MRNEDLLQAIKTIWPPILDIRKINDDTIQVKISTAPGYPAHDGWIHMTQSPVKVEKMIRSYLEKGGEIE